MYAACAPTARRLPLSRDRPAAAARARARAQALVARVASNDPALMRVDCAEHCTDDELAKQLSKALAHNTHVRELRLGSSAALTDVGWMALADVLPACFVHDVGCRRLIHDTGCGAEHPGLTAARRSQIQSHCFDNLCKLVRADDPSARLVPSPPAE